MAKIKKVDENLIEFDDGTIIECSHNQDCCEYNYADCEAIDDICKATDFDTKHLVFEALSGQGFRFGNMPNKMFFVPCYSEQNGYYSSDIQVYLNNIEQISLECEECYY